MYRYDKQKVKITITIFKTVMTRALPPGTYLGIKMRLAANTPTYRYISTHLRDIPLKITSKTTNRHFTLDPRSSVSISETMN